MPETTFNVVLHREALKELKALASPQRARAREVIDGLGADPIPVGAQKLRGRVNAYRIRIGDYRLVYEVHATEVVVYVIGIAHRKEVYRKLLRRGGGV